MIRAKAVLLFFSGSFLLAGCGSSPADLEKADEMAVQWCAKRINGAAGGLDFDKKLVEDTCRCGQKKIRDAGMSFSEIHGSKKDEATVLMMQCAEETGMLNAILGTSPSDGFSYSDAPYGSPTSESIGSSLFDDYEGSDSAYGGSEYGNSEYGGSSSGGGWGDDTDYNAGNR